MTSRISEKEKRRQYHRRRKRAVQRDLSRWALVFFLFLLEACTRTHGFVTHRQTMVGRRRSVRLHENFQLKTSSWWPGKQRNLLTNGTTRHHHAALPFIVQDAVSSVTTSRIPWIGAVLVLVMLKFGRQLLWPKSAKDPNFSQYSLPPGSLGCPFLGFNLFEGSKTEGPEVFYSRASAKLGHPCMWKFYFLGTPVVSVSGAEQVKQLQNLEFVQSNTTSENETKRFPLDSLFGQGKQKMFGEAKAKPKKKKVFTTNNLLFEKDEKTHKSLRRLVGQAMTPAAVAKSIPLLQDIANDQVDKVLSSNTTVKMQDVSVDYTLEVTTKQLLGLDLEGEEREEFLEALKTWLRALFFPTFRLPFTGPSPALKARLYLESVIEDRIDALEQCGNDGSTLSRMVFATDDESSNKKLTREQIVENALVLISAGSETTASTITFCTFLLGLHPDAWNKVVKEQQSLQSKYGNQLTKAQLDDDECPYLNAVVNEALRMGAVSGGFPRKARETFVMQDTQIPKGWFMFGNIRLTHELDPVTRKEDGSHMDVKQGFCPERWLSDDTRPVDFIPFGVGPRYCLGATLAMAEIKVFVAVMARCMDFDLASTTDKIEWSTRTIIPRPADEVPIAARSR